MSIFHPDMLKNRLEDITLGDLQKLGVRGLLLDVDNTLTTHGSQVLDPQIAGWLDYMKKNNIALTIVSNGPPARVSLFAERLGLRHIALACKPLPVGFIRGARRLGLPRRLCAAVGDQTFTDIIGANLAGVRSIQLLPILPERQLTLRLKRYFEKYILKRFRKIQQKKKKQ